MARRRTGLAVGFAVLWGHVLVLWSAERWWGLSMLSYLPRVWTWVFVLVTVAGFVLAYSWNHLIVATPARLSQVLRQLVTGRLGFCLLCLTAAGLFVAGSTAHHLLGDGRLYLDELADASGQGELRGDHAPLLFQLLHHLSQAVARWASAPSAHTVSTAG